MTLSFRRRWLLLLTVAVGLLVVVIDNTVLFTALPALTRELDATPTEKLWIINAYPLALAGLLLSTGTLGDRVGHRRMFLIGLVVLGVGSLLAAFSPTAAVLIGARAVLGVGAATMMPATLALVRMVFTDERELGLAIGIWGAIALGGAAVGPLVGGVLLEFFWWGSVFLVNVPIVVAAIAATWWFAPRERPSANPAPWDLRSSVQAMVTLTVLVAAIKQLVQPAPTLPLAIGLLVVSGLAGWRFVVRQRRLATPLLDVTIFRRAPVISGIVAAMIAMFAAVGIELATTQRLQLAFDYSPLHAGLLVTAVALGALPSSLFAGATLHRIGLRPLLAGGLGLAAAGCVVMLVGIQVGLGLTTVGMLVVGVGVGAVLGVASVAIVGYVPRHRAGMASSVEEVSYEAGGLAAVAIIGSVMTAVYAAVVELPDGAPAAAGHSIDQAHALAAGPDGPQLLAAAANAFDRGYGVVVALVMVTLAGAAAFVSSRLRGFTAAPEDVTPAKIAPHGVAGAPATPVPASSRTVVEP